MKTLRLGHTWLRVVVLAILPVSIGGAAEMDLSNPTALAFDHSGNLFVADHASGTIFNSLPKEPEAASSLVFGYPMAMGLRLTRRTIFSF